MNKRIVFVVSLLVVSLLIGNVLAVTASIGNARMILRAETGDKLEKSILIKNINNVSVNIRLTASGDLSDYITIKDNNFSLAPGGEKKAYFTIEVEKSGTTESKINVQFTPVGEKNGAGLSSAITVIADGANSDEDTDEDPNIENNSSSITPSSYAGSSITGNIVVGNSNKKYLILLAITGVVFAVFVVLLTIYYAKFRKDIPEKDAFEEAKTKPKKRVKRRG